MSFLNLKYLFMFHQVIKYIYFSNFEFLIEAIFFQFRQYFMLM